MSNKKEQNKELIDIIDNIQVGLMQMDRGRAKMLKAINELIRFKGWKEEK
jgi:hypothetical protein